MCKQTDQIRADLRHFNETGELPSAWAPEPCHGMTPEQIDELGLVPPEAGPEINDSELDEINRDPDIAAHLAELEAIESGCVEPPRFGWSSQIRRRGVDDAGSWRDHMETQNERICRRGE